MVENGCTPNLKTIKECPDYIISNEYILYGYRVQYTKLQCLLSIFDITNETINIWSHLFGFLYFLYLLADVNLNVLPNYKGSNMTDHIIMSLFCLCFIACLLLSACYHIFCCHSRQYYERCLRYDLMGISFSLWGCYIPSLYYGFYCYYLWRTFYTVVVVVMLLLNLAFQYLPQRIYTQKTDYRRITFFCIMVLVGIIPAIHWVLLNGGFHGDLVKCFLPKVVVMYIMGFFAFSFYMTKFPEKYFPGKFDFVGSSHQIWHTLVLLAFLWWYKSALKLMHVQLGKTCDIVKS